MNRKIIVSIIAAAIASGATAGINSPAADGYLARGIAMYAEIGRAHV